MVDFPSAQDKRRPARGARGLIAELRRWKVFRVAVVYAAVAFVVFQVADIAFPALQLHGWTVTFVVAVLPLGFPVALVLAWAFEITPDGVVRAGPVLRSAGVGPAGGGWDRQRIAAVGGALVLALAGGAFVLFGSRPVDPGPAALGQSIAVLPFTDRRSARILRLLRKTRIASGAEPLCSDFPAYSAGNSARVSRRVHSVPSCHDHLPTTRHRRLWSAIRSELSSPHTARGGLNAGPSWSASIRTCPGTFPTVNP